MAAYIGDTKDSVSVDDDSRLKQLGLNGIQRSKLKEITEHCESIFSWDIKRLTGNSQNLLANLVEDMREKCKIVLLKDDKFNLNKFYLQLIITYELYICGNYDESLKEIESIFEFMEFSKYDESNKHYSDAFNHIVLASYAYIALTLNCSSENILKNIKPTYCFNQAEKSAICAVKARVFMEYPPKGNDIALKFAEFACNLHFPEYEWTIIWLKAKGRVRRYFTQFGMPDNNEIHAAEILSSTKTEPQLLIQASDLFLQVAYRYKLKCNKTESNKYYKRSSKLILKAVELAKNDVKHLYSCLLTLINYPKYLQSKTVIEGIIQKLENSNVKNRRVDQVLGKYYLKYKQDYEKARIHLSRAMAGGHFGSSLQLIKVECLLQSVDIFPVVQSLNMLYDVFTNPKRRLIILSQILIYYNYIENNPIQMIHYLQLYIDQDIDDVFKKQHLIFAYPLFKVNDFSINQFLNVLSLNLKTIKSSHTWSSQEKIVINDTIEQFNEISKLKVSESSSAFSNFKAHGRGVIKSDSWNKQNQSQNHGKLFQNTSDCNHFQHVQGGKKWPVPPQNNSSDQKFKISDKIGYRKSHKQNINNIAYYC